MVHFTGEELPLATIQPTTLRRQQRHQRQSNNVYAFEVKSHNRSSSHGHEPRCFTYPAKTGLFLLVVSVLLAPMMTVLPWSWGTSTGVSAAPCSSGDTSTTAAQNVSVTPNTPLDLTTAFYCEGGDFEVHWSGEVHLTGTIVIGSGTTVRISGECNSGASNSSSTFDEVISNLTTGLALPLNLTSAAVGVAPPNITVSTDKEASFEPMFFVDHGNLILEDLIVRGGFTVHADEEVDMIGDIERSGGGIFAVNSSVSVTRCEFNDNYAQHLGGGIFVNASTLHVIDSMFKFCKAGYVANIEEPYIAGEGGGINVSTIMM